MKNFLFIFILSVVFVTIISGKATALSPTPQEDQSDTIEKIKDLVASKVAQLKLVEKRGIIGKVKDAGTSQIALVDHNENQRVIDIDELTKFQKDSQSESFGISDIKKDDSIQVIGLYNKETKRLLARFVSRATNIPINLEGVVVEKQQKEFQLALLTPTGTKKLIDIETSTKTSLLDEDMLKKSGFSKIEIGQRIIVVGFADLKEKDLINASRIIYFPNLPLSSGLKKQQELFPQDNPISTGSGMKLKPL